MKDVLLLIVIAMEVIFKNFVHLMEVMDVHFIKQVNQHVFKMD